MKIKHTKNIAPLLPFIKKALKVAEIDSKRIKRVIGYTIPLHKDVLQDACLIHHGSGYYTISIRLTEPSYKSLGKKLFKKTNSHKLGLGFLLDSIAHEVSHIKYWEHDINHFELQMKILNSFIPILKKLKIKDTSLPYDKAISLTTSTK